MEIKSKLSRSDFAIHVSMLREGETDSLHQIVMSYDYLIKDFRWVHDQILRENLHAAAWEGLIEGIVRGLDGRILRNELYSHLGPYAFIHIKSAISKFWELSYLIRIPVTTIRDGNVKRPTVISIHTEDSEDHKLELEASEEIIPEFSCNEILKLLKASDREQSILIGLRDDKTQQEIADELKISRSLVAMTLSTIRERAYRIGLHHVYRS